MSDACECKIKTLKKLWKIQTISIKRSYLYVIMYLKQ